MITQISEKEELVLKRKFHKYVRFQRRITEELESWRKIASQSDYGFQSSSAKKVIRDN